MQRGYRTMKSIFALKRSHEYKEFELWCDINNHRPFKLLQRYMREVVLHGRDPCGYDL